MGNPPRDYDKMLKCFNEVNSLTREERHEMLLEHEEFADRNLAMELISQEQAWDIYFGLLDECDTSRFMEDRPRILSKIDIQRYNPLRSRNPWVVIMARSRMGIQGLVEDN